MRTNMLRVVRWMKGSSSRAAGSLWNAVSCWIWLNTRSTDSCRAAQGREPRVAALEAAALRPAPSWLGWRGGLDVPHLRAAGTLGTPSTALSFRAALNTDKLRMPLMHTHNFME